MTSVSSGGTSYPMPKYNPPPKYTPDKNEDDLFSMSKLNFNLGDIQDRYEGVLGPLTLFAPFPHEDANVPIDGTSPYQKKQEPPSDVLELDRPVTPIEEEIKAPPPTFQRLAKLVRRRISARSDVPYLEMEDQQALAAVIMGEVNGIWPDIRLQVDDPFLSEPDNKELQRRITVHIVTVCEQLFLHYLNKAQILNRRGVFSGPANMSRLKAQLALDANKFLNILTIRRHLVSDMRGRAGGPPSDEKKPRLPSQPKHTLSYQGLIQASRPKSKGKKYKSSNADEEIREMQGNMPGLDTQKLVSILNDLPEERPPTEESVEFAHKGPLKDIKETRRSSYEVSQGKLLHQKSESVPLLNYGETLLEEMGIDASGRDSVLSLAEEDYVRHKAAAKPKESETRKTDMDKIKFVTDDLNQLLVKETEPKLDADQEDDDMPPLIQALTRSSKHDGKAAQIQKQLLDLEERERKRREEEKIIIQEASHPQPATVATMMPNKMVVKTSDIRVSERVCLTSVTLNKHSTVYNDLIDEIDPATVKHLDSNLFLGDEITEVYREIMKTVPTDHLDLENDELVEPAADIVNLNAALASASLLKKKDDRVINPELHRDKKAPWGNMDIKEWVKTPMSPPKDMKGNNQFDPMTPRTDRNPLADMLGDKAGYKPMMPDTTNMPAMMQELAARSYASWLSWWKNTINSDDYMKYLSTQETDYLGLVFHFYDSEHEDDEDEDDRSPSRNTAATKNTADREKEAKLNELKAQKTEYKPGLWNVNCILMGGLGKDPALEEDEFDIQAKTPTASEPTSSQKPSRSKTVVVSRKSQKSVQLPPEDERDRVSSMLHRERTRESEGAMSHRTPWSQSRADTKMSAVSGKLDMKPEPLTPQERLEKVWNALRMPDNQRLDMAIKYSSDDYHTQLQEAIKAWEKATDLIVQREDLMTKLENFERLASDPNRFFEKGYRGLSVARLEEAKLRSSYYKKIEALESEVKNWIQHVRDQFQDMLSYQGRPYLDKMHWDRTEMLYWLQEERKQQAIQYESRMKEMPMKMAHLEPITPQVGV